VRRNPGPADALQVLVDVLHEAGHVDDPMRLQVAQLCRTDIAHVRGLCSFYGFLQQETPAAWRILVSDNIVDRMAGSASVLERFRLALTGVDGISLGTTSCIGLSDVAPAALINGYPLTRLDSRRCEAIASAILAGQPMSAWPREWFAVPDKPLTPGPLLGADYPPGEALQAAMRDTPESLYNTLLASGLTGRGGAGFPTARKWALTREAPGEARVVVCNADEGEPGTFKDRLLLTRHADAVIEGMTLCAWYTVAHEGYLYLRGEYLWLFDHLQQALDTRRQQHLLGNAILGVAGFDFDIRIVCGAGAYICGEESALIESLEGKRGIPRRRPPFPVTAGVRQLPTVVNNVETFVAAAWIAQHGADAFCRLSRTGSNGTKLHSVSGDIPQPGVHEWPAGMTVREMLAASNARDTAFVQLGGPSGRLLFPPRWDTPVDLGHLSTGGSLMVFSTQRDPLDAVRNFAHFFAHESCGFCTPCRAGSPVIARQLDSLATGDAVPGTLESLLDLVEVIHASSHCGLGHSLGNALLDLHASRPGLAHDSVFHRSSPA
jgi:[NiFe] hydrogenase diaphorase moiety large subunit